MKIDDKFINEALQTDAGLPEEMKLFVSEQLGTNAEKLPVRHARTAEAAAEPREKRRGLVMGLAAIAAVAVLTVLAIKLIPALRPSSVTANPLNPGTSRTETLEAGKDAEKTSESYMEIPVAQGKLYWGMSEEEIIAVLGEPDERREQSDGGMIQVDTVILTYNQPIETALGFKSDSMKLFIDRGTRISDDEIVVKGLESIRFGSADASERETDSSLMDFYGSCDEREEKENPLAQLGVPEGQLISDRLYHWHAWEMQNHPELRNKFIETIGASINYQSEITGSSKSIDDYLFDDAMLVEVRMTYYKDSAGEDGSSGFGTDAAKDEDSGSPDGETEELKGVLITIDAGRLLGAISPIVQINPEDGEPVNDDGTVPADGNGVPEEDTAVIDRPDPSASVDPAHSLVYRASLSGLLEQQGISRQLSSAAGGKSFEIVNTPYVAPYEMLVNFKASDDNSTYCTAFIKYRDDVDAENVILSENKDVLVLDEYYIYNLQSPEAQDAFDLILRKYCEVYETPDAEILRKGEEAAIDAFFNAEPLFGPAGDGDGQPGTPEEDKEELRKHLKTITICDPLTQFQEPVSWVIDSGISFRDPRFIVGLQLDETTPDELRTRYGGIWGDKSYFYMSVVYIAGYDNNGLHQEYRAGICPASIDLVSYETYKNIPFGAGKLHWGMSAAQIRETLGEPDSWEEQTGGLAMTYCGPMEEDLGIGSELIKSVTLYTDLGYQLSENEFIQIGLSRIAVEFSKEFSSLMGTEGGIQNFFGSFDESEKMDELPALPSLPEAPEDLIIKRYRWYAWELKHQPVLREEYLKRVEACFRYQNDTGELPDEDAGVDMSDIYGGDASGNVSDIFGEDAGGDVSDIFGVDADEDMLVEFFMAIRDHGNEDEDSGGYITLDARRYLMAQSSIDIMLPGTLPDENLEVFPLPEPAGADTLPAPDSMPASELPPASP